MNCECNVVCAIINQPFLVLIILVLIGMMWYELMQAIRVKK